MNVLLGCIFKDETKDAPTMKVLNDISNRLDQISGQLRSILSHLDTLFKETEGQKYRADIAQASTIRDPLQQEINLINAKLANADKEKDPLKRETIRKKIIESINTQTVSGNYFYQQTLAMGDTIIRTMNQSQKDIFHVAKAISVSHCFPWDHQECALYANIVNYYLGTYLQAMAYSKLSILYQLELNQNNPVEYNNYISMFDILFSGNTEAGIISNVQKINDAFNAAPHNNRITENEHYAHYRGHGGLYVLRYSTFLTDSTLNQLKPIPKAELEQLCQIHSSENNNKVMTYIFNHFSVIERCGFRFDYELWSFWWSCVTQLLTDAKRSGVDRNTFFGEWGGLSISKNSRYPDFEQVAGGSDRKYTHDACTINFYELSETAHGYVKKPSGSLILKSSQNNMTHFDTFEISNNLRPFILVSQVKPSP